MTEEQRITAIVDYQGRFGSKWKSVPFRSGFDKARLKTEFSKLDWDLEFIKPFDVFSENKNWEGRFVLYTSNEEGGGEYKRFLEDIVLGLEASGAVVIPRFEIMRAHHNKIFMEIVRSRVLSRAGFDIGQSVFGTLEEVLEGIERGLIAFPCVVKKPAGAMSRGVFVARDQNELVRIVRRECRTFEFRYALKDYLRTWRRSLRGYQPESRYQGGIVIQTLIPDLACDWKVLCYGNRYFVLRRGVKPGDFRASGSHHEYRAGADSGITPGILDDVSRVVELLDVPFLSVDVVHDGEKTHLIEFQGVYFGTSTQAHYCTDYFYKDGDGWQVAENRFEQEELYALAVTEYLSARSRDWR